MAGQSAKRYVFLGFPQRPDAPPLFKPSLQSDITLIPYSDRGKKMIIVNGVNWLSVNVTIDWDRQETVHKGLDSAKKARMDKEGISGPTRTLFDLVDRNIRVRYYADSTAV